MKPNPIQGSVIADINTIAFPARVIAHRDKHTINDGFQSIAKGEIDITIPKGIGDTSRHFVFHALNVFALYERVTK